MQVYSLLPFNLFYLIAAIDKRGILEMPSLACSKYTQREQTNNTICI